MKSSLVQLALQSIQRSYCAKRRSCPCRKLRHRNPCSVDSMRLRLCRNKHLFVLFVRFIPRMSSRQRQTAKSSLFDTLDGRSHDDGVGGLQFNLAQSMQFALSSMRSVSVKTSGKLIQTMHRIKQCARLIKPLCWQCRTRCIAFAAAAAFVALAAFVCFLASLLLLFSLQFFDQQLVGGANSDRASRRHWPTTLCFARRRRFWRIQRFQKRNAFIEQLCDTDAMSDEAILKIGYIRTS